MRRFTLNVAMAVIMAFGIGVQSTPVKSQSIPFFEVVSTFQGDLQHADAGNGFIGVLYARDGNIYYNQVDTSGVWDSETLLGAGTEGKLAIDDDGNPHVVFISVGKIAYLKYDGSDWSEVVYIESNNGGACSKPDIAVDSDGKAHITYTDSMGNTNWYQNKPDIMYAGNVSGSFTNTLIYDGYYENLGGADYIGAYYDKGSFITLDSDGNYYIMTHAYLYNKNMSFIDRSYSVSVKSSLATGSTAVTSTDVFDIFDLSCSGTKILALYKHTGFKTSELEATGSVINFTNITDVTTTTVSSVATDGENKAVGGTSTTKLFTKHNELPHVYQDITVKGTTVLVTEVTGVFYAVYTDNSNGRINISAVAEPLSIVTFGFSEQTGPARINPAQGTITVEVASGTDISSLTASFSFTSDIVSVKIGETDQVSSVTVNDFTLPQTYMLKTAGEIEKSWVVTVTEEPEEYAITAVSSPVEGGSVEGTGLYIEGTMVALTAVADSGYGFVNWTENGSPVSADREYSFEAVADRSLTAHFIRQYAFTIHIIGEGAVKADEAIYKGTIALDSGTVVNLEAIAAAEYHFVGWSGDLVSAENTDSVKMDGDKNITATFAINQYTLTLTIAGSGSAEVDGSPYTNAVTVNSGTVLDLEAIAAGEYHFTGWSGDLVSAENTDSIKVDGDKNITATFAINQYTLTLTIAGSGSVEVDGSPYTNAVTVNSGTVVDIEAIAEAEYHFAGWSGDLVSAENTDSVKMDGDKNITATFDQVNSIKEHIRDDVSVFPNPFADYLSFTDAGNIRTISIMNITGQVIMKVSLNGNNTMNTSALKKGVYLVTMELNNGEKRMQKIMKD